MNKWSGYGYKRVTKDMARKMYCDGKEIHLLANKVNPTIVFDPKYKCSVVQPVVISRHLSSDSPFEGAVELFKYFNCNNEMGNYVNYYIKEE